MEANSNVVIQNLTSKAKKRRKRLWGTDFEGKKGKIVEVLINSRGEKQGYRIKFPEVTIVADNDKGYKKVQNFEYPFYNSEVSAIQEEALFPDDRKERKRRTQRGRETDMKTVKRLQREGHKISELAKRFEVSRQTIHQWLSK